LGIEDATEKGIPTKYIEKNFIPAPTPQIIAPIATNSDAHCLVADLKDDSFTGDIE